LTIPSTVGSAAVSTASEKDHAVNTTFATNQTDDIFAYDISDEALENAGGMSAGAQAGTSLYSTIDVSGCTCVG
jgi:hypothetical protein